MAIPDRLQPLRPNPQQRATMNTLLEALEHLIDQSRYEDDPEIIALIEQWNSLASRPFEFYEFRDFHSYTDADDFIRSAFHQEKYVADLSFDEACALADFVCTSGGDDSDVNYALQLLETNFANANASDLIFWPDDWFKDPELSQLEMTSQEIVGYLMEKSGRRLADAPVMALPLTVPKDL
ncbi:hypothetical protein [Pseudomonas sp. MF4836]|uniref:hypothetical protein n=1 Tax=Pseudomonas sp. MF4836 TaxID=1960827 RepID=UPI0009982D25|nr:hypothetical protein [Pseudomonas sp. MF4836]OOW00346.1 hypothetical protein MF4836_00005 [Pseudomonas sp. MF4836]